MSSRFLYLLPHSHHIDDRMTANHRESPVKKKLPCPSCDEADILQMIIVVKCSKHKAVPSGFRDKNNNPLQSAENAISATKLFAFPAKILIIEPVLPYILEEWISKNIPAKLVWCGS
ncbi:hypothetical protein TNCV_4841861 [Trichonephila clavipes]|uniref:Uncharacterized protein n=1 Tax=Trichonephila clavipes TaxID=2585209 RepID=A0A8X7BMP1_TRICX|nr:hypothetical protein TNCV_4841861 [Trichonephila clavipes]